MKKSYRIAVVVLSTAFMVTWASSQPAFGQKFRVKTGNSNQGNNNKDKDEDKDDQNNNGNQGSNNNQGKGGNQNNQGGNQNNANAGGSNKPVNSGNTSTEDKVKQFLQNKVNQGQGGNQNQFPGQGNSNKGNFGNRGNNNNDNNGFKGNSGKWKGDDDDWDNNKNRIKIGTWSGNSWQGSRKVDNWNKAYGGNQKLFSKQWYDDHPRAWNWDNHNHNHKSDVWVVASVPGMYQWLGWGSVPQEYRAYYNQGNVPQFDANNYGDWYPLGVYSLMTGPDDLGSRVVQLAVDRHGHLNGTYYDMITDNSFELSGEIQRQTQRAFWSLNSNPNVRFSASVFRLLQPDGTISVKLPGGDQRWQFVRLEN